MARKLGRPAFHYKTVDTTMRVAAQRAHDGCPEGTIVTANLQTAGRGRLGRTWMSHAGQGLYLSVVLRPNCSPDEAPLLTLVAGLGIKDGLERLAGLKCDIRWPNDILIRERKCCGILVEMDAEHGRVNHVVVGIGINLNHVDFPPELSDTATSLRIETGRVWESKVVLGPVLDALEACYELHRTEGAPATLAAFQQASSYVLGRRVTVEGLPEGATGPRRGVTAGLDAKGRLLLRGSDGNIVPVRAGSVRPEAVKI